MAIAGIICEYNPLHLGHVRQFFRIRETLGTDTPIVCLMSGNFVQRGHPALLEASLRARAAMDCGANLVLELPIQGCLSSAEGFGALGVSILSRLCTHLAFGSELEDPAPLMDTARVLLSPEFSPALQKRLEEGRSFPAARQQALEDLDHPAPFLAKPNSILAVEYCKAILQQGSPLEPLAIHRPGDYHAQTPDRENPSATALRRLFLEGGDWKPYVPEAAWPLFTGAPLHCRQAGEQAMVYRLRTMEEAAFEALPYGSEGLWRKLMRAARREPDLGSILEAVKSRRYTQTRLDRMVLCAMLGISRAQLEGPVPYVRVLGFDDRGRQLLAERKKDGFFQNAGAPQDHPQWTLEQRCEDLYGLFCVQGPQAPGGASRRRICYKKI